MDWGHQESLRGKVRVIERPENELEIEKQAVDCMSVDFPCPVSIQPAFHNRILISFGERPFSLALGMSKGPRPEKSWESQPLDYRDSFISEAVYVSSWSNQPHPQDYWKRDNLFL